jgi:hypothetical protein
MTFQSKLTPEQVEELILDWKDGCTVPELSVIYKVSIRTVNRRLTEAGVKHRHYPRKPRKLPKERERKPDGAPNQFTPKEKLKPCGTNAAYQRHRTNGEYPCGPCLEAHAENVAQAKARKKKSNGKNERSNRKRAA